jgi:cytochrome c oxidase assembly factor CtaG
MTPAIHAVHEWWSLPVPVTFALLCAAFIYFRGWLRVRRLFPSTIAAWRLAAFMSGLLSLWIPVASPLRAFDHDLLTMHMVQHILLMAVAPPLILLGAPVRPFLHGLSQRFVFMTLVPFLRCPPVEGLGRILTYPVFAWLAAMVVLIGWHVPAVFKLGLQSHSWHEVQHACFFVTGLLFWWPVVQPWPSVARWPRWRIPLYLFLATLPCDALSAFLAFCDRVVYSSYLTAPRLSDLSALQDQQCAGALMWACATFVYLVPAVIITIQLLLPATTDPAEQTQADLQRVIDQPLEASQMEVA